ELQAKLANFLRTYVTNIDGGDLHAKRFGPPRQLDPAGAKSKDAEMNALKLHSHRAIQLTLFEICPPDVVLPRQHQNEHHRRFAQRNGAKGTRAICDG